MTAGMRQKLAWVMVVSGLVFAREARAEDGEGQPRRVLFVLPEKGFDPAEVSMPWKELTDQGIEVEFATRSGRAAEVDPLPMNSEGSRWLKLRRKVVLSPLLARKRVKQAIGDMQARRAGDAGSFASPRRLDAITNQNVREDYDAIFFTGGEGPGGPDKIGAHRTGMLEFLADEGFQDLASSFHREGKLVAAICHGVLAIARARDDGGKSLLDGRRATTLPKWMEKIAALGFWLGGRPRIYRHWAEDEVRRAVGKKGSVKRGFLKRSSRVVIDRKDGKTVMTSQSPLTSREMGKAMADELGGRGARPSPLYRASQRLRPRTRAR